MHKDQHVHNSFLDKIYLSIRTSLRNLSKGKYGILYPETKAYLHQIVNTCPKCLQQSEWWYQQQSGKIICCRIQDSYCWLSLTLWRARAAHRENEWVALALFFQESTVDINWTPTRKVRRCMVKYSWFCWQQACHWCQTATQVILRGSWFGKNSVGTSGAYILADWKSKLFDPLMSRVAEKVMGNNMLKLEELHWFLLSRVLWNNGIFLQIL